jgi:Zn-dependent protease
MEESFRFGRIAGIPVGANWSVLVIFWLIAWSLASVRFPDVYPGYSNAEYWVCGTITALLFFSSLLAHELGHALVSVRQGVKVDGITLWLFGGVSKLGGESENARDELRMAAVGPAVSFGAGVLFGAVAIGLDALGAPDLVVGVPTWLALINVVLAVFNLAPAYPLDGGRVLRAVLWQHHGDRPRATVTAARWGRGFGYLLITLGVAAFALGGSLGGLWFVFLGWFLLAAARAEESAVLVRDVLEGVSVRDVMSPDPVPAPPDITVDELLEQFALRHRFSTFPLVDRDGSLVGLVTLARLKTIAPQRRASTRVTEVAFPLSEVTTTTPDEALVDLLERMVGCSDGRALVLDQGHLVGIVSPTDVARALEVGRLRRGLPK